MLPIGTKEHANTHAAGTHYAPLSSNPESICFWYYPGASSEKRISPGDASSKLPVAMALAIVGFSFLLFRKNATPKPPQKDATNYEKRKAYKMEKGSVPHNDIF